MNILKNPMAQVQKNLEINRVRKQKRKDVKDLRNSGIYDNGRDHYLDEDGHPKDDIEIPHWFQNLQHAWQANRKLAAQRRRNQLEAPMATKPLEAAWGDYCDEKVSMLGEEYDPHTPKRKPGRPPLPAHLKKNHTKVKRSDQMRHLLVDNGISIKSIGQDEFLVKYPNWEFLPNGRLRYQENQPISVHRFLQDQDLIPM